MRPAGLVNQVAVVFLSPPVAERRDSPRIPAAMRLSQYFLPILRETPKEAEIVSHAGQRGRVMVATNMAGRGTDIRLGPDVAELGGLHVICTELHESQRIDRQLIGRCGRQGDPGTYRQFLALDDEILLTGFGPKKAKRLKEQGLELAGAGPVAGFESLFYTAQRKVERRHFHDRKVLLYHEKERQKMQRQMSQDPYLDTPG